MSIKQKDAEELLKSGVLKKETYNKLKEKKDRKNKLKKIATYYTDKKVTLYNADAILIAAYGFIEQNK